MMAKQPLVTVVVPSFNQGRYLNEALTTIFAQNVAMEVFVMDGGSSDETPQVLKAWSDRLAGWRSHPDEGQAAAINEGVARGSAPYVYWLNSDDLLLPQGLERLVSSLQAKPSAPAAYGQVYNQREPSGNRSPVRVELFSASRLAVRCIVSQPGAIVRRACWNQVGGLDTSLHMALDYDLWWRLYKAFGPLHFLAQYVAVNREHETTKTRSFRSAHYREAIQTVRKHYGRVPAKWWLYRPYAVWWKSGFREF
jgi:glycosyltransferase involved in cell wall biosynthesis